MIKEGICEKGAAITKNEHQTMENDGETISRFLRVSEAMIFHAFPHHMLHTALASVAYGCRVVAKLCLKPLSCWDH